MNFGLKILSVEHKLQIRASGSGFCSPFLFLVAWYSL